MEVFPVPELSLHTSPYCTLMTRCVVTPPNRQLQSGDHSLAGFFFVPHLQFCCSQCRSGRKSPVDLGKKQETVVASLENYDKKV